MPDKLSLQCLIHFAKTNKDINKKHILEAATGGVLEKRGVVKNCSSESYLVKLTVNIFDKYLWRNSFLVNLHA